MLHYVKLTLDRFKIRRMTIFSRIGPFFNSKLLIDLPIYCKHFLYCERQKTARFWDSYNGYFTVMKRVLNVLLKAYY